MKKIGIITIHDTLNYGSLLQTYALYKAIESLGVEIELIDYKCKAIMDRETTYPLIKMWLRCSLYRITMSGCCNKKSC